MLVEGLGSGWDVAASEVASDNAVLVAPVIAIFVIIACAVLSFHLWYHEGIRPILNY